ncbi:hypothetical protein PCS_01769 [Desulfocurvibacter africanus PCS]|uniref:Uncharacterized protein n=1 Tax=Desulfocurvibacter africanus PCS TaxID=1262666 RepID=M5Q2K0_DESAF|nr:hypothetical protein [Desulfocurvibacter africanus]EMG37478.1 hypothetical protein PCS_01769 [Desulfocurvibacter africanus PCS]
MTTLKELFDRCSWKSKFQGCLPEKPNEIIYQWGEDEIEFAAPFFTPTGMRIYIEETNVVRRSLYLGQDVNGRHVLAVREQEKEEYRAGIPDMAAAYANILDPDKAEAFLRDKFKV